MAEKHREVTFEQELVASLFSHGWQEGDPKRYDRALALYPDDLIGWLQAAAGVGQAGGLSTSVVIAELQDWNKTVMAWEFHVAEAYRRQGIGRQLMNRVLAVRGKQEYAAWYAKRRTQIREQFRAYQRLGFRMDSNRL